MISLYLPLGQVNQLRAVRFLKPICIHASLKNIIHCYQYSFFCPKIKDISWTKQKRGFIVFITLWQISGYLIYIMFLKIPIILKFLAHDFSAFERPNSEKEQHIMLSHLLKSMFVGKLRCRLVTCLTGTVIPIHLLYTRVEQLQQRHSPEA